MQYREFGDTGVKVSALGFGAMRLPMIKKENKQHVDEEKAISIIHRAFELGVNYIDTAYGYCRSESEIVTGKALKGWRDKVYLSTKVPTPRIKCKSDYRRLLKEQLTKLGVDYIDFYHFHGLNKNRWEDIVLKFDLLDEAVKARDEGLIKHISFSFHDNPEVLKEMVDAGVFETLLCQYNLLDRKNEEAMAYAREKGVGIAVMGPVGGGRLSSPSEVLSQTTGGKSTAEIALRFVLANENVSCALSGMNSIEMVEENAATASMEEPMNEEELERLKQVLKDNKKLADLYCTGCEYCIPCPQGVAIPKIFQHLNYFKVYGLKELSRKNYLSLSENDNSEEKTAEVCIECGKCVTKCPQDIPIPEKLNEAQKILT